MSAATVLPGPPQNHGVVPLFRTPLRTCGGAPPASLADGGELAGPRGMADERAHGELVDGFSHVLAILTGRPDGGGPGR